MALLHADIERHVAAAGLGSTIIRPGMFASNVAAVAALTLRQEGHAGGDYVLTGPESLSQAEQVRILGDVLGRRIVFEELMPDGSGTSRPQPGRARSSTCCSTRGERRWGRPRTFRRWVADNAGAF